MTLILGLLIVLAPDSSGSVIRALFTEQPPAIDGIIDDAWWGADSAASFTQLTPDHGQPASEATYAHLLYDRENVYVAFRCLNRDPRTRQVQMSSSADGVRLFLDTFDDDNSCYVFAVSASGVEQSYRLTDDGARVEDWEGVWRSAVRIEPWWFSVEIAIPFKTLRYPPDLTRWGIDFARHIVHRGEKSYWARHDATGVKVSEMGSIASIRVPAPGLHLEAYPVGILRFEYDSAGRFRPAGGLDVSWFPRPAASLQLTAFPDFAQIEADPYQVNLSQYELRLPEKRPFFLEAAENFGVRDSTLRLFYSRRIGKPLPDGQVVPILGGAKYADRFGRYSVGALAAVTEATEYKAWQVDSLGNWYLADATEPAGIYSVASFRRLVLDNSELGLLYAGKDNERFSNHAAGFDATLRRGDLSGQLLLAGSQFGDSLDYGLSASSRYSSSKATAYATFRQIAPEFDANSVGLTDWRGRSFEAGAGPALYSRGPFRYAQANCYFTLRRNWDYLPSAQDWELGFSTYADFANQMSAGAWVGPSRTWYQDNKGWHDYGSLAAGGSFATDPSRKLSAGIYGYYATNSYNYRRFQLAPTAYASLGLSARVTDRVKAELNSDLVFEFTPGGELQPEEDITLVARPRIDVAVTPKMNVSLAGEVVRGFEPTIGSYASYYGSLLYSWTIRPRSTIYVALNQRLDDTSGRLQPTGFIAVLKLRYLFVF